MNRKYVVIRAASNIMAEIAAGQIYVEMDDAKAAADTERQKLVDQACVRNAAEGLPYVMEEVQSRTLAVAKSFVKVYELVAVDL